MYEAEQPEEVVEVVATTTETEKEEEVQPKRQVTAVNDIKSTLVAKFGTGHPLLEVARCESQNRQYNADGSVLRGVQNSQDVGVFQINERYHLDASRKMGLDIHTTEGNMEYAEHLYETQGLQPWSWSKSCWSE